jgi:hypothetical protein
MQFVDTILNTKIFGSEHFLLSINSYIIITTNLSTMLAHATTRGLLKTGGINTRRYALRSYSTTLATMSEEEEGKQGFDTIALHGGYTPDTEATYGLGKWLTLAA